MDERLAIVVPVYNEPSIEKTLQGLYDQALRSGIHHFIVDNGSTDNTRTCIAAFTKRNDTFPLTVIEEAQKGTGAAADTGFRAAIDRGYSLVARTDGDSVPAATWTQRIVDNFAHENGLRLLGGKSVPLVDEHYRIGDVLLLPNAVKSARLVLALKNWDSRYLKAVVGHNMATRSDAYTFVGGFKRSSIIEADEDVDYSTEIIRRFGRQAIKIDPSLKVATSMRRIRKYGIVGASLHHLFPNYRERFNREIDIR